MRMTVLALVAVGLLAAPAMAAPAKQAAKPSYSPRDLTGLWMGGGLPKLDFPYNAEYAAIYKQRLADDAANKPFDDPAGRCITSGMPAVMLIGAYPWEIFQSDKQFTFLKENGSVRRIQMKRGHDESGDPPTYMGDSTGRWDGDVLVVDTTLLKPNTVLERRLAPHSDVLHIVERIKRTAYDVIEDEITLLDPKAFTRPWTTVVKIERKDDWEVKEFICQDNNRYVVLPDGSSTIKGVTRN